MHNIYLTKIIDTLKKSKIDAYYLSISNENLYEFTSLDRDIVYKLTGFTGDTGSMLILQGKAVLYVDGRFTIQAKKEVSDKRIKIVEVNRDKKKFENIVDLLKHKGTLAFNPKIESAKKFLKLIKDNQDFKIVSQNAELEKLYNDILNDGLENGVGADIDESRHLGHKNHKLKTFDDNYFILDSRYVSKTPKQKISNLMKDVKKLGYKFYLTSSLEEIAYLTNLRKWQEFYDDDKVVADAFMIVGESKSKLYLKQKVDKKLERVFSNYNILLDDYSQFYKELKRFITHDKSYKKETISKDTICFDPSLNNYYIYKILGDKNFITSPLIVPMSIKEDKEIVGLKKCNVTDGVAITKAIYDIKSRILSGEKLNEYDAKLIVDSYRREVGKNEYISPSFNTIVAYKENSAICHYSPTKEKSKVIKDNSLLLIDSGGNYLSGTTDITRTISLYKGIVPKDVKKHFTLVLNSMMKLAIQRFPYGLTGTELDIVSRQNLYNEYLDFNHGTGHGIGYVSNVHEGPNRIGPGLDKQSSLNVLEIGQVCSDEPGVYFEGKYGIRIENDLLTSYDKITDFGDFLRFEMLTLCPFDRDLIDRDLLDKDIIPALNKYNELVYAKLSKRLNEKEKTMLRYDTKKF